MLDTHIPHAVYSGCVVYTIFTAFVLISCAPTALAAPGDCLPLGDAACTCDAGGYGPIGGPCEICPENHYCSNGTETPETCPENTGKISGDASITAAEIALHPSYGPDVRFPQSYACRRGCAGVPNRYAWASDIHIFRRSLTGRYTKQPNLHGMLHEPLVRVYYIDIFNRGQVYDYSDTYRSLRFSGIVQEANPGANANIFLLSALACADNENAKGCKITLPSPSDYVGTSYIIDPQLYNTGTTELYKVPYSTRRLIEKNEDGTYNQYCAESVMYSTNNNTADPTGTFYGYLRVTHIWRQSSSGTYNGVTFLFDLPYEENMRLVDFDISNLGDILYLTTTSRFYSYSLASSALTVLFESDKQIVQAHMTRDWSTLYLLEYDGTTLTLATLTLKTYEYTIIETKMPADFRLCQFPTLRDYAFTSDGKLYRYNFASGTTIKLLGTARPSSAELDQISAPTNADVSSYNLIYGADHHCSVLDSEFTDIVLKDRESVRRFYQGATKAAVSQVGSAAVTDCQCSADSHGIILSTASTCTACPLHEGAESGAALVESDCTCYDGYEYTEASPDTCVKCSEAGCLRDILPPAEVVIKLRVSLSVDGVKAKSILIRQAMANRLGISLNKIIIHGIRFIRMGKKSGMRRLLQDLWESEVTVGVEVPNTGVASTTDTYLTTMTKTIESSIDTLSADIAVATGATVVYDGSSCDQLTVPSGYWPSPTGCGIIDIDECQLYNPCNEIATCTNLNGSYTCDCPVGTYGDGVHCDGNSLSVRITVEVNTSEFVFRANYAKQFTETYSTVLLTQSLQSTEESLHQATHALVTYSESPTQSLYVDMDVLFASLDAQHTAWQAFNPLLFVTGLRSFFPVSYALSVAYGVRKLTLQGLMTNSVQTQASQGLTVLGVEYDPTCPPTGCWKVTAQYSSSDPRTITAVYVPRVQTDATGDYTSTFINSYNPSTFPCRSDDPPPSMCCVPSFLDVYRPLATLQTELLDTTFQSAIAVCDPSDPYQAPQPTGLLTSHNYIVGHLQGVSYSRVEYKGVVNIDTDTHEIQIIFDEDELRSSMSIFSGNVQTEYTLKTFLGMSFATPMGTSAFLDVKNQQVSVTVRRTNYFTVSASGPIDFTNIDYSSAVLHQTKVNYGFETVYLQHAEVTIQFKDGIIPDMTAGPFPLQGIRVGKGSTLNTVQFVQACSSANGTGIFEDAQTQAKFAAGKAQSSCAPQVDMCVQPTKFVGSMLKLYVPLGENFWTDADVNDPNIGVYVDVMVNLRDAPTNAIARSSFRAYAPVVAGGIFEHCESVTSSVDLTNMLSIDLVVGTDLTANPNDPMPAGTYFAGVQQAPGSDNTVPTDKINISASTVQSAMLSVVVRGDPVFFDLTDRYSLGINDVISMHFLESTPTTFNQVSALVVNGGAFTVEVSASTGNAYLAPSAALLSLCSFSKMPNYFDCVMRRDVQSGVPTFADRAYEYSTQGETAAGEFMAAVFKSDGTFAQDLGKEFWRNVTTRFGINDRYNRAWSINPSHTWSTADVQNAGFSRASLQTNLLMFALVTLRDNGAAVGRRLLQVGTSPTPSADMSVSRAVQNSAIDNVAQKCAALGIALDRCAVLVTRLQMPFKSSYCDVLQNTDAYAAYYADLKLAVTSAFTTKYVQGQQSMHVLPYDIRGTLDAACSASSISRRLLQSTLTAAAEIAYEVTTDGKLAIDMASMLQSDKVLSVRRLDSASLAVEVTDTALGTVVDTSTVAIPTSTTTTETSSGGSNNTVLIVAGIVAAVAILYFCGTDHDHKHESASL